MTRVRALVVSGVTVGCLAFAASAAACSETWIGPDGTTSNGVSGSWEQATNWTPTGIPAGNDTVCITAPGTYTVTLAPTGLPAVDGDTVSSLTLGAASGTQTLDVSGQSGLSSSVETVNETSLDLTTGGTINPTGTLILDATAGGTPTPVGGGAMLLGGTITNSGKIVSQVEDSNYSNSFYVSNLTNDASGSLQVSSGALTQTQSSSYPWQATNDGSMTIAAGASLSMTTGLGSTGAFTNNGSVVNDGSTTATEAGGPTTWTQSGGSVSGNAVVLQNGTTLADSVGGGSFLFNHESGAITGTIPAVQTVTVQGEPFSSGGETTNSTTVSLGGGTVVNDGTLVLDAPGSGSSTGGAVFLTSGGLQNNGKIEAEVTDPSWAIHLEAGLTNNHSGSLALTGGSLDQDTPFGTTTTNDGLVTVGPGAQYLLEEASSFVNASDGTVSPEIASAASIGTFQLASPCCDGAGTFTAAGTLAPVLVGGFVPAANQEFEPFVLTGGTVKGAFATVGNSFSADYSHESSSPTYVGVIYHASSTPPPSPGVIHVGSISGGHGEFTVKLSCSGATACARVTVRATVTEHLKGKKIVAVSAAKRTHTKVVVIATAGATLAAGATKTLTVNVNKAGGALLGKYGKLKAIVTLTAGGKTLKTTRVEVQRTARRKRKK